MTRRLAALLGAGLLLSCGVYGPPQRDLGAPSPSQPAEPAQPQTPEEDEKEQSP